MTLLTVIFVLGPMYEDGNGWYIMLCTSSMLYYHLLNPLAAILSFTLLERTPRLPRSTVKWALLPTAVYGAVLLWMNYRRMTVGPLPLLLRLRAEPGGHGAVVHRHPGDGLSLRLAALEGERREEETVKKSSIQRF